MLVPETCTSKLSVLIVKSPCWMMDCSLRVDRAMAASIRAKTSSDENGLKQTSRLLARKSKPRVSTSSVIATTGFPSAATRLVTSLPWAGLAPKHHTSEIASPLLPPAVSSRRNESARTGTMSGCAAITSAARRSESGSPNPKSIREFNSGLDDDVVAKASVRMLPTSTFAHQSMAMLPRVSEQSERYDYDTVSS